MAPMPKLLYVRAIKDASGQESFLAATDITLLKFAVGESGGVGVYKLTSKLEALGTITTTEVSVDS
jgi:hypothetical protein